MAAGSTAFVWIKLATAKHDAFAKVYSTSGLMAGQVAAYACACFTHWRLHANQVRIHLAAGPGEEPSDEAISAALARADLPVTTHVPSGAWLVAAPTASAAAALAACPGFHAGALPRAPARHVPREGFLADDLVGLLCAPATLPCDATVAAAFARQLQRAGGDARELAQGTAAHASAASLLPAFAEQGGGAAATAQCSGAWVLSPTQSPVCEPALDVQAATSAALPLRPGFGGQVKSAADCQALGQAAYNTALDMTRVFFPAADARTPCARRYFTTPPLGFALVGSSHVAYIAALEWVGKLLVSPLSQPFVLESAQHAAALAALPDARYQAPVELGAAAAAAPWQLSDGGPGSVCWQVDAAAGVFRKVVRGDARSAAQFARMARVYAALAGQSFQACGGGGGGGGGAQQQRPEALRGLAGLRLLYGAHEVLVEMRALRGRPCSDAEATGSEGRGALLQGIAAALAWLAVRGVVYTDLRGPNVLLEGEQQPQLVDFDDCVVVEGGVRSVRGFKGALAAFAREEGLVAGFAVSCAGGRFPELEGALAAAFAQLGEGEGEGEGGAEGGGAGSKRARS